MRTRLVGLLVMIFAIVEISCREQEEKEIEKTSINREESITFESDSTFANRLFVKGDNLSREAKFDSANICLEKAATIYRKQGLQYGKKEAWEKYVECYNSIGDNLRRGGSYEEAAVFLSKALQVGEDELRGESKAVARSHNNIGLVHARKGDYGKALEHQRKALSIRRRVFGENHTTVATSYNSIGMVYDDGLGDYEGALEFFQKASSVWRESRGENHRFVGVSYNNIGTVYHKKGNYDLALEYYQKALSVFLLALGENHPWVASIYNNVGSLYNSKGDYDSALEYHKKTLSMDLQVFGKHHPNVAGSYNNIGTVYEKIGNYKLALENHNKALSIRLEVLGENRADVAISFHNIGAIHYLKEDLVLSMEHYHKALSIFLNAFGENHPEVAKTYLSIGDVKNRQNDFDRALHYYQKAITALILGFDDENINANPTLHKISNEPYLMTTLSQKAKTLRKLSVETYSSSRLSASGALKLSLSTYKLIAELIDNMRIGHKSEGSKLLLVQEATKIYNDAIQTALLQSGATNNDKHNEVAFLFAEKSRSGILMEALSESEAKRFAGIPDSLLRKEQQLRSDLSSYDQSLIQEQRKGKDADLVKGAHWQDKVFNLKQEYEALLEKFAKEFPDYHNLRHQTKTASVADVQEQILDESTTLVEYFTGKDSIFIFVITQDGLSITTVARDSLFEVEVERFREGIIKQEYSSYIKSAYRLYQILLEPVVMRLRGESLIIIPDGAMSIIPFEAILTHSVSEEGVKDYAKLPYLTEKYAISYAYSATLLQQTLAKKNKNAKHDYLAFAPVFPNGLLVGSRGADFLGKSSTMASLRTAPDVDSYLPFSKKEVRGVLDVFQSRYGFFDRWSDKKTKVLLESDATEANVKASYLADYRYVHFATHGFIEDNEPKLSGLALFEDPNDTTSTEDGYLYLGEVYNLSLNADLVVLSACETGLGEIAKGEGILGLTRGFLYAGASNMLVSLWKVNDRATPDFMVDFYSKMLSGTTKAEALREAKRAMIGRRHPEYSKPYYWAPFVLIGR